jgi:threonine dehydratase
MHRSLAAGEAIHLDAVDTLADGLAAPMAGALTHAILASSAAGVVLVSDAEIVDAMRLLLERTKLLVEPAGAAGLAALLAGRIPLGGGAVVVILSGGNVDLTLLARLLGGASLGGEGRRSPADPMAPSGIRDRPSDGEP